MTIPQAKLDYLEQMSQIYGVAVKDLVSYYEKHLNDPAFIQAFQGEANPEQKAMDYIDSLIIGFTQNVKALEEVEFFVATSQTPYPAKSGQLTSSDVGFTVRGGKQKYIIIRNNGEDGRTTGRLTPLSTGKIKVSIREETDQYIIANSNSVSELIPQKLSWVPDDNKAKIELLSKWIRQVPINEAAKNLSTIDTSSGFVYGYSLRMVEGTIVRRNVGDKFNDNKQKIGEYAILNVVDKSVATNPDFFKDKTITDPKDASKTIKVFGGFSLFCEPEDVKDKDRGTLAKYIGTIVQNKDTKQVSMNCSAILPIITVAPKKPTDRLQKPKEQQSSGVDSAAI